MDIITNGVGPLSSPKGREISINPLVCATCQNSIEKLLANLGEQNMAKPGISIDIPGFGLCRIDAILTDYTGTLSRRGLLVPGVRERLIKLAEFADVHVITADTFGLAKEELEDIPLKHQRLEGSNHDMQKREYGLRLDLQHAAALGNGNNDRLLLKAVKEAGGVAMAVDNGEGCSTDALLNSNLFIVGAANALDLLIEPQSCKATLRS